MTKTEATWQDIDITTMPKDIQAAYEAYKQAQRQAAGLRAAFETQMNDHAKAALPAGYKLVFGYRFGKLSAAVVENEAKPKSAARSAQSLGDFLKSQAAQGRRS